MSVRVTLWGFVALATSKEWYEYVSNPNSNRLGPFAWLTFYVSSIELCSIYKFRGSEFVNEFPIWINAIWSVLAVLYIFGLVKAFQNGRTVKTKNFNIYNPSVEVFKHKTK